MPWAVVGGAVAAGGGIAGSLIGANAAKSAQAAQQQAQQNSLNWIQNVYGQTSSNLQPFIGAGQSAVGSLLGFYGLPGGNASGAAQSFSQFQNTPFYQFPLQQANLGAQRSLAASGLTGSPGAIGRTVGQLDAGYASSGLTNYLSGLGSIANSGQGAATALGGVGTQTSGLIGAANTNFGNAAAQGAYNTAGSINQGIGSATNAITGSLSNPNVQNGLNNYFGIGQSSYGAPTQTVQNPNVLGGSYQAATSPSDAFS